MTTLRNTSWKSSGTECRQVEKQSKCSQLIIVDVENKQAVIYSRQEENNSDYHPLILPKWSKWPLCVIRDEEYLTAPKQRLKTISQECRRLSIVEKIIFSTLELLSATRESKLCSCGAGGARMIVASSRAVVRTFKYLSNIEDRHFSFREIYLLLQG